MENSLELFLYIISYFILNSKNYGTSGTISLFFSFNVLKHFKLSFTQDPLSLAKHYHYVQI